MSRLVTTAIPLRRPASCAGLALVTLTALAAACADAPSGPQSARAALAASAQPNHELLAPRQTVNALTRTQPLAQSITVSKVIDRTGGSLEIPEAGVKLSVDSFTVGKPTTFTITAIAGTVVAYDFTPEGAYPTGGLKITQLLAGTSGEALLKNKSTSKLDALQGGYFRQAADLDDASGTALVSELLPATADLKNKKVEFKVKHFSGYMVSTGRR